MRYLWGRRALCLLLGIHALLGWSQPMERVPNPRATDGGWVVDMAGVREQIEAVARRHIDYTHFVGEILLASVNPDFAQWLTRELGG